MKKTVLFLVVFMSGFVSLAQSKVGSISLCIRSAETNESFGDIVTVSLEGVTNQNLNVKPDSNGCVLLQKLAYGTYAVKVKATDRNQEKIIGIIVKDDKPVLLDVRMKSSVMQIDIEVMAYRTPVIHADSWVARDSKTRREEATRDSLYRIRRQEQKLEHEQLKQGTWKMTDSLMNKHLTDLKGWNEYMKKNLHYPQDAVDMGIDAKVYVGFETDEKGYIQNLKLLRGHDQELTVDLFHTLNKAPGIVPTKDETGKPVSQKYILAVKFRLE